MMRTSGQNGLIGHTMLHLDSVPDIAKLEKSAAALSRRHPLLDAKVRREVFTLRPGWYEGDASVPSLPIHLWCEPGAEIPEGRQAESVDSESAWTAALSNFSMGSQSGCRNLRLDLLLKREGRAILMVTWAHLLFDGRGAEYLIGELVNPESCALPPSATPDPHPFRRIRSLVKQATPVVERFFELARNPYASLGGPRAQPGRLKFRVLTIDTHATSDIQARAAAAVGPLFSMAFYLACALRAHREVFRMRGRDPEHYVVSVPVQIRKKATRGARFHNNVTILFFCFQREDLKSVETATQAAQEQFEQMTRDGLERSFSAVLEIMCLIPSPLYMAFLKRQFGGEITSFFHSFTGDFAGRVEQVFGAQIDNAVHIPSVSSPPGTGLFCGLYQGRLNLTLAWREGAATDSEVDELFRRLEIDLMGSATPTAEGGIASA